MAHSDAEFGTVIPPIGAHQQMAPAPDRFAAPIGLIARRFVHMFFSRSRPTTVGSAYTETCRCRGTRPAKAGAYMRPG